MRNFIPYIILLFSVSFFFDSCKSRKKTTIEPDKENVRVDYPNDEFQAYKDKYASTLGVEANALANGQLYMFVDDWMGVPYKWAGNDKNGVDCSGFVGQVFKNVYTKDLERSATKMVDQCEIIKKEELKEGDLVFFDISDKNSHVGIYLANQKFIHASSSKGVMISDLTQSYWVKYWGRAGRVK